MSLLNGEGTYVIDGQLVFGTAAGAVSNPQIQWEKQKTLDVGFDMRLFNNRIDITADYFKKRTEDLLVIPQVSGLLGVGAPGSGAPTINAGIVENKGIEFALTAEPVENLTLNATYSYINMKNPAFATPEQEKMGLDFNKKKIDLIVDMIDRKTAKA